MVLFSFADEANFTKIATNLYDPSSSVNALLRQLLRITDDSTSDSTTSISPGIIAGIVIAVLVTVGLCVVLTIVGIMWFKRYVVHVSCVRYYNSVLVACD